MEPVALTIPPTLWDAREPVEAVLHRWVCPPGASVEAGAFVAELMVDKVTMDVEAPAAGRLEPLVDVGAVVAPGAVIGRIHPQPR